VTDPFEDRLRAHFAAKAATIEVVADPDGLMDRAARRSVARRPLAIAAVVLAAVIASSGVLTGVELAGGSSTKAHHAALPAASGVGGAGAMAPYRAGASASPSIAVDTPYTLLFTRTTASGVTIRAYQSAAGTGGCTQNAECLPPGRLPAPTPCPTGALCAQPQASSHAQTGVIGGGTAQSGGGSTPPLPVTGCGPLIVELSTDEAVGRTSVPLPSVGPSSSQGVVILGAGSFGTEEGAPVGWVAAWVADDVVSAHLVAAGVTVDAMAPSSGMVVLAVPGNPDLGGASVVGLDQGGTVVGSSAVSETPASDVTSGCPSVPTSTTTTTQPPTTTTTTPQPAPTTTSKPPPTTTTTTTTVQPPPTSTTTTPSSPGVVPAPMNMSVRWRDSPPGP
jgi:hypothetical protein